MIALVVDDSAAMRRAQQKALQALGWEVHVASGAEAALEVLDGLMSCHLIVTDWHMPGMDGLELIRTIRADARNDGIRILLVTSDSVLSTVDKAVAVGADDVLMKPFTPDEFTERVSEVMSG